VGQINALGYGLTLGEQSRIDETIARVVREARVGNQYVNRNMVGAVVGVQPFGGEGLSGTGPKAGGPLYLHHLWVSSDSDVPGRALEQGLPESVETDGDGAADLAPTPAPGAAAPPWGPGAAFDALMHWLAKHGEAHETAACSAFGATAAAWRARLLAGPTGERNVYALHPRRAALCLADTPAILLRQSAAALAVGCPVIWPNNPAHAELLARLPPLVQDQVSLLAGGVKGGAFDVVLHHGSRDARMALLHELAERPGPIVRLWPAPSASGGMPLEALVIERSISINTAAAGGNASLMTIR
ncbi:MAG: aldehyde dehydrogenase family protein, partial [Pigmentiphaga sp.]